MPTRGGLCIILAALAGFTAGAIVHGRPFSVLPAACADGHGKSDPSSVKAPVAEVMHCPLAFEGTHRLKELPEVAQVAYHYCKPIGEQLIYPQGPARLFGASRAKSRLCWHPRAVEL